MLRTAIPIHLPRIQHVMDMVLETRVPAQKVGQWMDILRATEYKLRDGYIRPSYRQSEDTGGWYTRSPNLQGLRDWMLAELIDDKALMSCDYTAMHPAVAGWLLQDKQMMDAYRNGSVYEPINEISPNGKVAMLALMNMASVKCIAERCCEGDMDVANELVENVYACYPLVKRMHGNKEMGDSMRRLAYSVFNKKVLAIKRKVKIYLMKHDEMLYVGDKKGFDINMGDFVIRSKHKSADELKESRHEDL